MALIKLNSKGEEVKNSYKMWEVVESSILRNIFINEKDLTIEEIAKKMNRPKRTVENHMRKMGLKKDPAHRKFSEQFKKTVVAFYEETSQKEVCEKFNITETQLEGIVYRARRLKGLAPIKIGQRKNEWKVTETVELLRYIGLKPIPYIAEKLGKSNLAIESYLKRRGFRLHYVNGLKQDDFYKNFKVKETLPFLRNSDDDVFIPWVTMENRISEIIADDIQIIVISAMANFQRFLHNCKENKEVIDRLWQKIDE